MIYPQNYKQPPTRNEIVAYIALAAMFVLFLLVILPVALDREFARQEKVKAYNCAYYGKYINQHAGHEVCPDRGEW